MLVTTPQSRLTPCQLPGRGAFLGATTNQKLSPRAGKVAWRSHDERGTAQSCQMPRVVPPQLRLRSAAPHKWWRLWGYSTNTAYSAVPLRGAIVSMGLRGSPGGLRGEIEIFPGPLAKKDYKIVCSAFCLFYSFRLLVSLASTSLDREPFGAPYQLFSCSSALPHRYAGKLLPSSHFHDIFES